MSFETFQEKCIRARDYVLNSPLFKDIYIGVIRSVNGTPDFYACNNPSWMKEYIEKELWYIDPIVRDGLLIPEHNKEKLLSWNMEISHDTFFEYRNAFTGSVKGFSKVLKRDLPQGFESIVIGIGLYPDKISPNVPMNVNAIFAEAERRINAFILEPQHENHKP